MDDIKHDPDPLLTRLRNMAHQEGAFEWEVATFNEAADEIKRLRAEINGLVSASEAWGRVPKLEAEIEALRAMCNDLYHDATCHESFCRLCGEGIRGWEARRG